MRKLIGIAAFILLVVGLDLWVMLGGEAAVAFTLWPFTGSLALPPAVTVLLGVLIGLSAAIVWTSMRPARRADPLATDEAESAEAALGPSLLTAGGISAAATAGILLVAAAVLGQIEPVTAALAYALGCLAAIATLHALRGLSDGEGVAFDSYWGGLGGAQGGWRLSPVTVTIILALVLIAGTVAVATGTGPRVEPGGQAEGGNETGAEEEATDNKAGNAQ